MSNLTPEERQQGRMAILQDVKANLKRYKAVSGTYVDINYRREVNDESLQKLLENDEVANCEVCAMGAMFLGYVNKFNNYNVTGNSLRGIFDAEIGNILKDYFGFEELKTMEGAFEGYSSYGDYIYSYQFQFEDENERLEAIIDNCIRNGSYFHPDQDIEISLRYAHDDDDYEEDNDCCDFCGDDCCGGECEDEEDYDDDDDEYCGSCGVSDCFGECTDDDDEDEQEV